MSNIGICEYVIGVIHDKEIWYYVGEKDVNGESISARKNATRHFWLMPRGIMTRSY